MERVLAPTQAQAPHAAPMVFWCPCDSNRIQCESINQELERWPNVWMSTTPPHPVLVLLLPNHLGYKGPTMVKHILCLEPSLWVWALERLWTRIILSGEGAPSPAQLLLKALNPL